MELIIELTGWIISSTEIMSSNISDPSTKKYDNPSEKVIKTSGDLDYTKKALVTTTDTVLKEGNIVLVNRKRKTKPNVVKKAITTPISEKKKIVTVNKTEKSQAFNKAVNTTRSNKTEKIKSIDK